jgi:hypothetical protein
VLGPKFRKDDPGETFDEDLDKYQPEDTKLLYKSLLKDYQDKNYINAISKFFSKRQINNVEWTLQSAGYFPTGSLPYAGTAGYAYDEYVPQALK